MKNPSIPKSLAAHREYWGLFEHDNYLWKQLSADAVWHIIANHITPLVSLSQSIYLLYLI